MCKPVTDPDRIEWLLNNSRLRSTLPASALHLLPSGTTANEALHAELNSWFRQIQQVHRSTLQLKLAVFHLARLLAWYNRLPRIILAPSIFRRKSAWCTAARAAMSSMYWMRVGQECTVSNRGDLLGASLRRGSLLDLTAHSLFWSTQWSSCRAIEEIAPHVGHGPARTELRHDSAQQCLVATVCKLVSHGSVRKIQSQRQHVRDRSCVYSFGDGSSLATNCT